eukprot:TRINITY_DN35385_c0_g1_i1.p1 TRINITY_DN35385_c0_g1~~TRINITY_DN35385_c0_g1_i1.p1  ORF type:complete len:1152 (-),score=228.60 TRINITY_DN35385_c0_g1_i1:698-4153(-)
MDLLDAQTPAGSSVAPEDWRQALARVVSGVVVLRITTSRAFDTESANCSHATGIVVDKKRGLILTNRHVIKPGPVVAEAVFLNREEIPVHPLYRDPVHDFGFLHFDPSAIQFLDFQEIELAPEAAVVGLEIRVVGNDSGEKLAILAGTIARLDRDAPHYKKEGYNDFNTFYLQAASGTKGGSSGSPVIDSRGRAVAMNAGSKSTSASAFYLPLNRVVRALELLRRQRDEAGGATWQPPRIPRGTLQMTLVHKGFDEARHLGLQRETEQLVRGSCGASETGMLVVDSLVPGGPANKAHLEPGDVLVKCNGEVLTTFLPLETVLDDSVDQSITLEVERGGKPLVMTLSVQDLHSITPNYFLELSGAVLHALSYQQARNFRLPHGLVYVADAGYMLSRAGISKHAILKTLAGKPTPSIREFYQVYQQLARGARVPLEYITHEERHRTKTVIATIDSHEWYGAPKVYVRNDSTGLWDYSPAATSPLMAAPQAPPPQSDGVSSSSNQEENNACAGAQTLPSPSMTNPPSPLPASPLFPSPLSEQQSSEHQTAQIGPIPIVDSMDFLTLQETTAEVCAEGIAQERLEQVEGNGALAEQREGEGMETDQVGNGALPAVEGGEEVEGGGLPPVEAGERTPFDSGPGSFESALVMLDVHVPPLAMVDGVHSQHFLGTAVILHHEERLGLLAVDRNTVAVAVSDILITFAGYPIEIPGEVVFLHPVHNFALVAYNPALLPAAARSAIRAAKCLPDAVLRSGSPVRLVGLNRAMQVTSRKSNVTNPAAAFEVGRADSPRYHAVNTEVIEIDTDFGSTFAGVLANEQGGVYALWSSFSAQLKYDTGTENHQFIKGLAIKPIWAKAQEIVRAVASSREDPLPGAPLLPPSVHRHLHVRQLEAELSPIRLASARSYGLSDKWVQALLLKDPLRRRVLRVKGVLAGSQAEGTLQAGDLVLAISGKPVTSVLDVEAACRRLEDAGDNNAKDTSGNITLEGDAGEGESSGEGKSQNDGSLLLTLLRKGAELNLRVRTDVRDGLGTQRLLMWAGALLHAPHPAVRALGFLPPEGHGVYIVRWFHGSPAHRFGLYALHWITQVNGRPTPDLDTFVQVTQDLKHGEFVRVRSVHLTGKPKVLTLKLDRHYWATWELRFDAEKALWRRTTFM